MNKRIIISAAAVIALAACSEDKGAGTSVGTDSTAETLSDADIAFMNSMLDSFGSSNKAVVSDDIILDEVVPTDEPTLTLSPVLFTFTTGKEVVYNEIKSSGSCWVNLYDEEKGIVFTRLVYKAFLCEGQNEKNILLQEDEHSEYQLVSGINEVDKPVDYLYDTVKNALIYDCGIKKKTNNL